MSVDVPAREANQITLDGRDQTLHVHDLPQLYTRPSFVILASTLDLLRLQPTSFSGTQQDKEPYVEPQGVPRYLTNIIASSLSWLADDSQREQIWEAASARLSERSGRSAMPSMTRSFQISDELTIDLFEPSLTEDNLGLKTWTSSLLLARRLPSLRQHLSPDCHRVLELGSGTGLVGIAAAALWQVDVMLTDLPEIVPNLQKNVESNRHLLERSGHTLVAQSLDWEDASDSPKHEGDRFSMIIAADPIYSSDHPRMLVNAVSRWIERSEHARFVLELPLRKGYAQERQDLRERLVESGMQMVEEGTETGYDDWQGADGRLAEVECWWSVWKLSNSDQVREDFNQTAR